MTKTMKKKLESALKRLEKCGGDCKQCKKCHFYFCKVERSIYYAVGCDALPEDYFTSIANYPSELHREALEAVKFELSLELM